MNHKHLFITTLGLSLIALGCVTKPNSGISPPNKSATPIVADHAIDCISEETISAATHKLYFERDGAQAREQLLRESKKSPDCRKRIIAHIMREMDKPDLNFDHDPSMYIVWRDGADLLAELKAEEALDLLISHLDLQINRFSTTMSQQPALHAVIRIGPAALPKLAPVLKENPKRDIRLDAVYCIAGIGGLEALRVLNEALPNETDPCVSKFISVSLDTINPDGGLKNNTVKWFSAFMCN